MTVTRHNDLSLQYILVVPSDVPNSEPLPLVVVLHGRGADANDLADLAPHIDDGYRFVFPNAPRPFEPAPGMSFGFSWFDGWPPQGNSLAESRDLLLRFLAELLDRYPTPDGQVVLAGFSQGGLMSLDVGFRTPQALAGIVVMSGAIAENDLPDLRARREQPVIIVHGLQDDMIPVLAARRTRRILEEHGIEPEYHEFPMGHFVIPESLTAVGDFIRKVLAPRLL